MRPGKANIRQALTDALKAKAADVDYFADMVEDYLSLWDVKEKLRQDIKTRGVVFDGYNSAGLLVKKNNPSTKELTMLNRQMLSLLRELGLTTKDAGADDNDDL